MRPQIVAQSSRAATAHVPSSIGYLRILDGPPADWDELKARIRTPVPRVRMWRGRCARKPLYRMPAELSSPPSRTSTAPAQTHARWRPADQGFAVALTTMLTRRCAAMVRPLAGTWWRRYDPVLVQRLLLLLSVLLIVDLALAAF